MFLIFVLTELIAEKTLLSSKLIKTVLIHVRACVNVHQLSRHISWISELLFQSDTPSEGGIELEAQPADRLSEDKDNYFRDGKRKIGTQFPASRLHVSSPLQSFHCVSSWAPGSDHLSFCIACKLDMKVQCLFMVCILLGSTTSRSNEHDKLLIFSQ